MHRLEGKVALVTGGASGIGRRAVERFVEEGALVAVADRNLDGAWQVAVALGERAMAVEIDVCAAASVDAAVVSVVEAWGRLDTLVNNAGVTIVGEVRNLAEGDWDREVATNLKSVFLCSRSAWDHLAATRGSIVNASSIAATTALRADAAYCASKAGVLMLTTRTSTVDCRQVRPYSPGMDGLPDKSAIARGRVTARLQSTEVLRDLILSGSLAPGERMNEVELATQLGMSRGPIRESLQRLAAEGLVTIRSHKGTFVKTFTAGELANLYEVRRVLEAHASRLAALRRTETEIEVLGKLLALTRERMATEGVFLYENDFHLQILAMTHNDVLAKQGQHLLAQMGLARSRSASSAERGKCALDEHQAVFDAIYGGDDERAASLMEHHLGKSYENAKRTLEPFLEGSGDSGAP